MSFLYGPRFWVATARSRPPAGRPDQRLPTSRSATQAAIAGVVRSFEWMRQKLYMKCSDTALACAVTFLLNPFVSLVNRRMCMRIVRFWRSSRRAGPEC